jgi:hypothetical protein
MAGKLHVVLRNEVVVIVEMRILKFLVPLRVGFSRVFRFIAHNFMVGGDL